MVPAVKPLQRAIHAFLDCLVLFEQNFKFHYGYRAVH
jgi:hypothetical protein